MILWTLGAALAQDVGATTDEEPDAEMIAENEIIVYGEILVARARRRVERTLKEGGYTEAIDRGDHVIYRHSQAWKGEVLLYEDGWMQVRRQRPRVEGREWGFAGKNSPAAWMLCAVTPWRCVRTGGITVSKRKFRAQEGRAVSGVHQEVESWSAAIADLQVDQKVNDLPEQLTSLWEDGVPLEGEGHIATMDARKQALLSFWMSRTETRWGEQVRAAVESFIRAEVQYSDYAFTPDEIATFNQENTAWRPLVLEKPSEADGDGVLALPRP